MKAYEVFVSIAASILLMFAIAMLVSLPVMWLWDWLMPELFGLKEITWLQALGITLLSGLLFRSSSSSK